MIFECNQAIAAAADAVDKTRAIMAHFGVVRRMSGWLIEPLSREDCCIQSMPDASPVKWHLGHTTWFFEQFILVPYVDGYRPVHERFSFLFNSYYNTVGDRQPRPKRGLISRPSFDEVLGYCAEIDRRLTDLLAHPPHEHAEAIHRLTEIGIHHEQQHQELMLTDLKHLLSCNPLAPAYREAPPQESPEPPQLVWSRPCTGQIEIGHAGDGFAYDNEGPRHRVFLEPFQLADRLITCGEYLEFIRDGGYERAELWLDEGWSALQEHAWTAPLYWHCEGDACRRFTLTGIQPLDRCAPVTHVSFFEADAFARWLGVRLPAEAEWEVIAARSPFEGNFLESCVLDAAPARGTGMKQLFGDVWEWTGSQYRPYPGYQPPEGALGEYNGKFMSSQFVLRGGSCATPRSHIRRTYRNFFRPSARWQFTGIRLARSVRA